ncbi:transposase, partial [Xanthomonas hortorum pv. gardneri]
MAAVLPLTRYQPLEDWRRQLRAYQQRRMQVVAVVQQQHQHQQLAQLDARIVQQLAARAELQVLRQVNGVGPVLVASLAAQLPELGRLSGKTIARLVGVAPLARDSGATRGVRRIWGGRAGIRQVLY